MKSSQQWVNVKNMKKIYDFLEKYSSSLLRYGMSAVILWFSFAQFANATEFSAYIPTFATSMTNLSATTLVYINACFEFVFGTLLVFGWQTRFVSFLLAVHMFDIMYTVGYGEIGVRDMGLAIGIFAVFMNGPDPLCIQHKKKPVESIPVRNYQYTQQPKRII